MRKHVVILVDDDPTFREMLRTALRETDVPDRELIVYPVGSGAEALLYLRSVKPDLLILDLKLPDMDGLELCRRVRQDPILRRVPVLAVSGLAPAAEVRERAIAAGSTRFLAKPFDLDAFAAEVRGLLPTVGR
jgi:CheY-like chemotaxis protein